MTCARTGALEAVSAARPRRRRECGGPRRPDGRDVGRRRGPHGGRALSSAAPTFVRAPRRGIPALVLTAREGNLDDEGAARVRRGCERGRERRHDRAARRHGPRSHRVRQVPAEPGRQPRQGPRLWSAALGGGRMEFLSERLLQRITNEDTEWSAFGACPRPNGWTS
jgi:hypothetical protein